jgi:hypothetical protein
MMAALKIVQIFLEEPREQISYIYVQSKIMYLEKAVANMAPDAISSSLIMVIHDNMINETNHIV